MAQLSEPHNADDDEDANIPDLIATLSFSTAFIFAGFYGLRLFAAVVTDTPVHPPLEPIPPPPGSGKAGTLTCAEIIIYLSVTVAALEWARRKLEELEKKCKKKRGVFGWLKRLLCRLVTIFKWIVFVLEIILAYLVVVVAIICGIDPALVER